MHYVYILKCRDGSYYVGSTSNLEVRLRAHQLGLGAKYTKHRLPVALVWCAEFSHLGEAVATEKRIQGWSRANARH